MDESIKSSHKEKTSNKTGSVRPRRYNRQFQIKKIEDEMDATFIEYEGIEGSSNSCNINTEEDTPCDFEGIEGSSSSCNINTEEDTLCDYGDIEGSSSSCNINTEDTPCDFEDIEGSSNLCDTITEDNENQLILSEFIELLKSREEISYQKLIEDTHEKTEGYLNEDNDYVFFDAEDEVREETEDFSMDSPIYAGHAMTVRTSILLIWLFAITHSLTTQQLTDLLSLISIHMLGSHPFMSSFYKFKRFFQYSNSPLIKHYYCSYCYKALSGDEDTCTTKSCKRQFSDGASKEYFIELPVKQQIDGLFSRKDFVDGLSHKRTRIKRNESNIEDVYDSVSYKKFTENLDSLHDKNNYNISFTFHTDGIPVFKSSKKSMWPIFLMINELPFNMRRSRSNMILCGLWYGKNKPLMNLFCRPLHDTLFDLEKGVHTKCYDGTNVTVRGYMYCVTCDIPARNGVLNMNQHNGASCCPKCTDVGNNYRTINGGNVRVFPFNTDAPLGKERSAQDTKTDAESAFRGNTIVNGMKGPSFLMFCPEFDFIKGTGIDYMHLVFLGVTRLLLNLWFNVSNAVQEFSIYKYVEIVDDRLLKIKPSHFVTRPPRSISEDLKFWKAAELRSWFFYYSIPCVMDLMRPKHFYHYCCLVEAIFLLNQTSINDEDIVNSERLLQYFVFMMPGLYGERYMTINVHSLLHLPQTVRELGPLWAISCFPFESASGDLLKMFHGTQYIDAQIINAVHVYHMLPSLTQTITETSMAYPLITSLLKMKPVQFRKRFQVCGRGYERMLNSDIEALMSRMFSVPIRSCDVLIYKRAIVRGVMYHSMDYTRAFKRNSYTIKFLDEKDKVRFGFIQWFAKCKDHFSQSNDNMLMPSSEMACIKLTKPVNMKIFELNVDNIKPDQFVASNFMDLKQKNVHFVETSNDTLMIQLQNILDLCMFVKTDQYSAIFEEPNHYETNL